MADMTWRSHPIKVLSGTSSKSGDQYEIAWSAIPVPESRSDISHGMYQTTRNGAAVGMYRTLPEAVTALEKLESSDETPIQLEETTSDD